jgi:hypothetical protein
MHQNGDPGDLPDFLDRSKTMPKAEYEAALKKSKDAVEREKRAVPAMPQTVRPKSAPELAQEERKKEKSRVRVEQMLAKKAGETSKMPATGREALAIINAAEKRNDDEMSTTQTATTPKGKMPPTVVKTKTAKSKRGVTSPAPKAVDPEVTKTVAKAVKVKAKADKGKAKGKAKTAKAKAVKGKAKAAGTNSDGFRPGSKLALIAEMISRKSGATEPEMNKKLGWSACLVTARRVAERMGKELVGEKDEDGGPTTWFAR